MKLTHVLAAALAFWATMARAEPFGFTFGAAVESLQIEKDFGTSIYRVKAPLPNSEFQSYFVTATPKYGVCKIAATG